jgi:hypothetical protein
MYAGFRHIVKCVDATPMRIQRLASVSIQVKTAELEEVKLRLQKHGLMHNLLTGKVRVPQ